MKKTLGLAAAALLTLSLASCSGDDGGGEDAYCDQLNEAKDTLEGTEFDELDQATFDEVKAQLDALSAEAPSDVEADWETVTGGFDEIESLFEEAGIDFDDLESLQSGEVPEGVDLEKLQELAPRFEELGSDTSVQDSIENIQTDAEERCDITFEDDSGS